MKCMAPVNPYVTCNRPDLDLSRYAFTVLPIVHPDLNSVGLQGIAVIGSYFQDLRREETVESITFDSNQAPYARYKQQNKYVTC